MSRGLGDVYKRQGGERNRLLLARLFARPANLLVMDEPTNDLDLESLELLETTLQSYPGTLVLVSHDRTFLDNVVTSVLVARGGGRWLELVGGYSEWLAAREVEGAEPGLAGGRGEGKDDGKGEGKGDGKGDGKAGNKAGSPRSGLGYKEARELAELPGRIEALEQEQKRAQEEMSRPEFFKASADQIRSRQVRLAELEEALTQAMARWEMLMAKDAGG